ncbi:hypothetical protein D1007_53001 [Hordeum vulgare]|nr:hypothetical protein D1007_53001 [Hordeum vulgare]
MANFTCNPFAFLPSSFSIEHGLAGCKVRADMALSTTPPLCNDDFAIAELNRSIPIHLRHVARQEVARLLNHDRWVDNVGLGLCRYISCALLEATFMSIKFLWLGKIHPRGMNGVFGPANGANQDEEEPVIPDQQHAPLLFFPPAGQVNYQAILRQQGVSFSDGFSPTDNIIDSPLSTWNDNANDDSSDSSEDSGQIIALPSSIAMPITLTRPTGSQAAAEIVVDNATVPDLYYLARSVILNLQVPTISRGPFGIQIAPVPLHLITWNPLFEEVDYLCNPVAPATKVARKLWFEDFSSSSDRFEIIPSSVVISELRDDDIDSQILDISEGVQSSLSAMTVDSHVSPSRKRGRKPKPNTPLCTTKVRRSPCSNKYMGFKVDQLLDDRGRKSLIKPRMSLVISNPAPFSVDEATSSSSTLVPPPMIIKDIQQVGTGLCGIPPEELTDECLLAKRKEEDEQ